MSEFDESKVNRDEIGRFADKAAVKEKLEEVFSRQKAENGQKTNKTVRMSAKEKIESVRIEKGKDNILPELNDEDLVKIGVDKNKPVLVKASIVDRNASRHPDVDEKDIEKIIGKALYASSEIFKGNKEKPYYTFVKPMRLSPHGKETVDFGLVLLDVDVTKDNFEVVHWHWINNERLEIMKNK